MKIGTIESIWRYPVKGMRGEELPYVYTAFTGVMGDRIYGVAAADGDPGHPWHTGRNQEEFVLSNNACTYMRASYCASSRSRLSGGVLLIVFRTTYPTKPTANNIPPSIGRATIVRIYH